MGAKYDQLDLDERGFMKPAHRVVRSAGSSGGAPRRRYDLAAMTPRLGWAAVRTPPMPYRLLKLAEAHA